jgi:SAM-dependent methyltransferase
MSNGVRDTFDQPFFDRFYFNRSTAVVSEAAIHKLAKFVLAYLDFLGVDVDTVLDAGCGIGLWKRALCKLRRQANYTGIDVSEFLCRRYGWTQTSIAEFRSRRKYDLVVCQDVLQYADDDAARRSIDNLARMCRGALYFDVATKEDMKSGALDKRLTDRRIHLRSTRWYRRLLDADFVAAGGGVFIPRASKTVVLALERV